MSVLTFSLGKVSGKSIEVSFIPQEIIQRLQRVCNNRVLVGKVVVCHIYNDLSGLLGTAVPVIIMLNTLFYHCR